MNKPQHPLIKITQVGAVERIFRMIRGKLVFSPNQHFRIHFVFEDLANSTNTIILASEIILISLLFQFQAQYKSF